MKHIILLLILFPQFALASNILEKTNGMEKHEGFFTFYWDESEGKVYLQINQWDKDFLYVNYLQSGVGSNDIGLDRGQIGDSRLVKFQKLGNKVLLVQPNLEYRAISDNALERKAVEDGFTQSVLWGGNVEAESNGSVLVDLTSLIVRDSHDISGRLSATKQGSYKFDKNRSALFMANSKSFPKNTEFEALITLQGTKPGSYISSVAPTSEVVSVRTHHSFVQLPETPYKTRKFDARSGAIYTTFEDYAAPLGEDLTQKLVVRHRLEKKNPQLDVSDPIEPIVYYLDPGTPEPIRSALIDGAKWWSDGFEAAGFSNAFEVKLLPENSDPLDVRYNTIQWVHRSTRGWSYGASIIDPRTGEILKGHVTLGSLRVRQDMLIAQGLLSPYKKGINSDQRMQEMALARLRQLSAHEVGHTLGLIHNFSASAKSRASVMDYPHPLVKLNKNGEVDLTDAYAVGLGEWDKTSLSFIYAEYAEDEGQKLENILQKSAENGYVFIADRDARTQGGSHPSAHLWDNGENPIRGLNEVLAVRKKALSDFGVNTIKSGEELFKLEQILTPIYLFHRYQTEAVSKLIGGVNYRYAHKGEANVENQIVDSKTQKLALDTLLKTLQADTLALDQNLLNILLPPPAGSSRNREHFKHRTGLNFDALGAAETAARIPLKSLLNPQKASRLIEHKAREPDVLGLEEILETLLKKTWGKSWNNDYLNEVQNNINWAVLQEIMALTANNSVAPQVQAIGVSQLKSLSQSLKKNKSPLAKLAREEVQSFLKNRDYQPRVQPKPTPPGSPIGME